MNLIFHQEEKTVENKNDAEKEKQEKLRIDGMSHFSMAHLSRFAPSGHPYFVSGTVLCEYFQKKFKEAGGWTPEISKEVGWH